jgi:hypothetical protein
MTKPKDIPRLSPLPTPVIKAILAFSFAFRSATQSSSVCFVAHRRTGGNAAFVQKPGPAAWMIMIFGITAI